MAEQRTEQPAMPAPTTTTGGTDLRHLIKTMTPTLLPTEYVFARLPPTSPPPSTLMAHTKMAFVEPEEAWTLIIPRSVADAEQLDYSFPCRQITLHVHSSLDAVGFLAAVTTRLAERVRTGVNPVSGYYHDHLFIAVGQEEAALAELRRMALEYS